MRDNDGRKLDHKTLETLRMRSVQQIESGEATADEIAVSLGLARSTVFAWVAKYREGGLDALKAKPVPGAKPKLSGAQVQRLYDLIVGYDPAQLELELNLWTREVVRTLIRREFKVSLSAVSVGRLLRKMGLSPQRPLWRAWQADPEAVRRWKTEEFPAIRAAAKKDGALVYFADEAGLRSDFHAGTTWAPVGKTPVVKTTGARHSVNMMSAVTALGELRFTVTQGAVNAAVFIDFCTKLLRDNPDRPVYLIVDGHPAHKAKKTKAYVASTDGRLTLFTLPGYSPQLNPDEWVWKNVKHDRVGRTAITSADDLKTKAVKALRRLQRMPHLVRGFFHDPDLHYITA